MAFEVVTHDPRGRLDKQEIESREEFGEVVAEAIDHCNTIFEGDRWITLDGVRVVTIHREGADMVNGYISMSEDAVQPPATGPSAPGEEK